MTKRVAVEIEVQALLELGKMENRSIGPVSKMARILGSKSDEEPVSLQGRITTGTFKEDADGKINEVRVLHEGHTYTYDFSKKADADGSIKQLFHPCDYSRGAPPYIAMKVDPKNLPGLQNAEELLTFLHTAGIEGIECLDDPPRLVKCTGPNGKESTIVIAKTKNQGDLFDFGESDAFKQLSPQQHLQLIKDVIKGQYLQDLLRLIQIDGKLENILVHQEEGKLRVCYADFDDAILFRKEFYTDKEALKRFIAHLERVEEHYVVSFMSSLADLSQLIEDLKSLSDFLKQHQEILSETEHGSEVEGLIEKIHDSFEPIQAYQMGVTLYRLYTKVCPYEEFRIFIADFSSNTEKNIHDTLNKELLQIGLVDETTRKTIVDIAVRLLAKTPRVTVKEAYKTIKDW